MDPALRELLRTDEGAADEVEAIVRLDNPFVEVENLRIVSRFGPIATCRIRKAALRATWKHDKVRSLKAARPLGPEREAENGPDDVERTPARWPGDRRRPAGLSLTGKGVVVAVIDWGCDFDHLNFKHADGSTRLLALWDQRGPSLSGHSNPYGYGRIHNRRRINLALGRADPYAALAYHPADADPDGNGTHGTHVMDIAAGNGRAGGPAGVAPEADLIFVHLANQGTAGLANLGDSVRIVEAVDFIARTAGPRPWVINLSVGRHGGPHDGCTLDEMAFDAALQAAPGRFIVQSAGNYFNKNIHLKGHLNPSQVRVFNLKVHAADFTPNEIEVWYAGLDAFSVQVESPAGRRSDWISLGTAGDIAVHGAVAGRIYNRAADPNNADNHIDIFLYPTAPPGRWRVRLRGDAIVDGRYHAWIERDEACSACQMHFGASQADSRFTIGTLANGHLPLVVGAYNGHSPNRTVAPFSSVGPTRDNRPKPDLAAPGVAVLAARSAPRGWHESAGLLVRKSGTSMAAPHVTGTVALCLQGARRPLKSHHIRELILSTADPAGLYGRRSPRLGHGYLDIAEAVKRISTRIENRQPSSRHLSAGGQPPPFTQKEQIMETSSMNGFFDHIENSIRAAASHLESEHQVVACALGATEDETRAMYCGPDALYRDILAGRGRSWPAAGEHFEIIALPAESPASPPRAGDVLVRIAPGEPGLGHAAVLTDSALWPHSRLTDAPFDTESRLPGFYAPVIDGGAYGHTRGDLFARRILDGEGRMLPDQLLLRPGTTLGADFSGEAEPAPGQDLMTEESPPGRRSRKWRRTNIQLRVLNYRGVPLEHYLIVAYIVDIRTGEKALLGRSKPVGKASTGALGVVALPAEQVPAAGTLVINAMPDYRVLEDGRLRTKGEFVGDFLTGSTRWSRRSRDMLLDVAQEYKEIIIKARSHEEAQSKLKQEGKIGIVLGPLELGGGGGRERGRVKGTALEIEYKAKIALSSLKITGAGKPSREASESLAFQTPVMAEGGPDMPAISALGGSVVYPPDDPLPLPLENVTSAAEGFPGGGEDSAVDGFDTLPEWENVTDTAEANDKPPPTAIEGDIAAMADEIINRPLQARRIVEKRFGSRFSAELLRTLAAWRLRKIRPAYHRLMKWNLGLFYKYDEGLQKRFIATIVALRGSGAPQVRLDVALSIVETLFEHNPRQPAAKALDDKGRPRQRNWPAMLNAAEFLAGLVKGETGVRMMQRLEGSNLKRQARRIIGHILIWYWMGGQRIIGELLGQMSYLIALQATAGVRRQGGRRYSNEEVFQAQASLLGRTVAHVEMAVEDWSVAQAKRSVKASAAHGAAIVGFALDMVMFLLPGAVSKVVDSAVKNVRKGVKRLEAYEKGREGTRDDPREKLKDYMLEAANVPFFHLTGHMVDNGELEEEDRQVLAERFRLNMKAGREDARSRE